MLEEGGIPKTYRDLEVIFHEGDAGDEMYVIKKGKVKLTKKMQGIMTKVAVLEDGDFFGEMALFEDAPRSATAIALGKVQVVSYNKDALTQHIKNDPTIALKMLKAMSQRVRKMGDEATALTVKGLLPKEAADKIKRYTFAGTYD